MVSGLRENAGGRVLFLTVLPVQSTCIHTQRKVGQSQGAAYNGPLGEHGPQLLLQTAVTFFLVSHLPL